jgi:transcriptional regulator with XRE-family HTH domain
MVMPLGRQHESGPFAQAVSEEVRATMARKRVNGSQLARAMSVSPSYVSTRLRDTLPFTLNDVEAVCQALGLNLEETVAAAARTAAQAK